MNTVILTGRITHDLERRTTQSGTAACQFDIAVDRNNQKNETDFIHIIAWDKTADFVLNYLGKGRKILVSGSLHTRTYTDKDTGKKIKVYEVVADRIEFADSRPQGPFSENGNDNSNYGNGGFSGNNGYGTGGPYYK